MRLDKFTELADKFETFYVNYKTAEGAKRPKTYMVATHNLDTPYIQAELKKAPAYVRANVNKPKDGYVALFSYTQNRFRVIPVDAILRLSMLSVELDKAQRQRGKR